jgi:hypothetical protein
MTDERRTEEREKKKDGSGERMIKLGLENKAHLHPII